jgi:AmmeMemoRadiSam system protein A
VAREPLTEAVRNAAISAATLDPRFPPVTESELDSIEYDISVLTPLRVVRRIDEIQIGRDGLMIEKGGRRGLLLPQVASERGWDRLEFLRHTCTKAGLDPAAWERSDAVIYRFSAQVFDGNSH